MKGYEIYSWQEEGEWVFKVITGTNRQKSVEEIMSNSETVQDDAWTNIKIEGVENLKIILKNLPKGESIFWMSGNGIETVTDQNTTIAFPPDSMIEDIREFCEQIGLDLTIIE
jgi:hypothetical protein